VSQFAVNDLNRVKRRSGRAQYEKDAVYAVLDEALTSNVGVVRDDQPVVLPMIHARVNNTLYLHGAKANQLLKGAKRGNALCISITLVDGIVFSRSAFGHSMNYRSVTIFGAAREVTEDNEKLDALRATVEHIAKRRWDDVRKPNEQELRATSVIAVEIESASGKMRTGPPRIPTKIVRFRSGQGYCRYADNH
jgi:nitroimidazol reductase NimA-like FMN-containing flavoprotein (pyridoxamine 5'-phosphate oxidase superfamily)